MTAEATEVISAAKIVVIIAIPAVMMAETAVEIVEVKTAVKIQKAIAVKAAVETATKI